MIALQKPVRPVTGGEPAGSPLFYIRGIVYMQKIFLNYDQQIEKLKNEKNLLIDNEAYAKDILKQTSYYSLIGGYKDIFKNPTTKNNIGFQRGLELLSYNCGFNSRREH